MPVRTRQEAAASAEPEQPTAVLPGRFAPAAAAPDEPDYSGRSGQGRRIRRSRLPRALGRFVRARPAARPGHDPLFGHPDMIENDYYRFLQNPRG